MGLEQKSIKEATAENYDVNKIEPKKWTKNMLVVNCLKKFAHTLVDKCELDFEFYPPFIIIEWDSWFKKRHTHT